MIDPRLDTSIVAKLEVSTMTHLPKKAIACAAWVAAAVVATPGAPASAQSMEQVSIVYEEILWNSETRLRLEADFRRAVAASQIKVSPAEIAGAAQAAFDAFNGSTVFQDAWRDERIIRGCGPAGQLCFVITCNRCRAGK